MTFRFCIFELFVIRPHLFFKNFLAKTFFYGATDICVWWHLIRVWNPEWAALFALGKGMCDVCSMRFSFGVTPANLLTARMMAGHCSPHACFSRGRMPDLDGRPRIGRISVSATFFSPFRFTQLFMRWVSSATSEESPYVLKVGHPSQLKATLGGPDKIKVTQAECNSRKKALVINSVSFKQ